MTAYEPVVIERKEGQYRVMRGDTLLLAVPMQLFESFEQDSVFPPSWRSLQEIHPVRHLHWHPLTRQFLMTGLERHPARTVQGFSSERYRSFLHGLWLPTPPTLLLRPYWNPEDPYESFDRQAQARSLEVQLEFYHIMAEMRPPQGWATMLNAADDYLETLGVTAGNGMADPDAIEQISLVPTLDLDSSACRELLDLATRQHSKAAFPIIQHGCLAGLHILGLRTRHAVEAQLEQRQIGYQLGPRRPH